MTFTTIARMAGVERRIVCDNSLEVVVLKYSSHHPGTKVHTPYEYSYSYRSSYCDSLVRDLGYLARGPCSTSRSGFGVQVDSLTVGEGKRNATGRAQPLLPMAARQFSEDKEEEILKPITHICRRPPDAQRQYTLPSTILVIWMRHAPHDTGDASHQ